MSIKVLIVDDSAVVREVLTLILEMAPDIEVMGACFDPIFAMQKMKLSWPDVIVSEAGSGGSAHGQAETGGSSPWPCAACATGQAYRRCDPGPAFRA